MTKELEKTVQMVVARLAIKGSVTYLRTDVDKKENKHRGPKELGQSHVDIPVVVNLEEDEYKKRINTANEILKTGKIPDNEETVAKISELESTVSSLESEITSKSGLIESMKSSIKEKDETIAKLTADNSDVTNSNTDLKTENDALKAEIKKLKSKPVAKSVEEKIEDTGKPGE